MKVLIIYLRTAGSSVSFNLYLTFDQAKLSCRFWLLHKEDMYRYMQRKTRRQAWVTNSFLSLNFFILQISQHTPEYMEKGFMGLFKS